MGFDFEVMKHCKVSVSETLFATAHLQNLALTPLGVNVFDVYVSSPGIDRRHVAFGLLENAQGRIFVKRNIQAGVTLLRFR